MLLKNKHILVAITGSIALYKTCDLIRLFIKSGAKVRVVMSQNAKKFANPLLFEALTNEKVLDESTEDWSSDYNHIAIGKWADLFIIAPATANSINKLSNGIADNLITQIALAYPRMKLIAPAANTNMIENPLTIASLKMLHLCNYKVISPQIKELACKDIGNGAMADPIDIYDASCRELLKDDFWRDRKVVVSAGGTIEKIDDVRFISNFSTGKMGVALANALYYKGCDVCVVKTTSVHEAICKEIHQIDVSSSEQMKFFLDEALKIAQKGVLTQNTLMDKSKPELIRKKPFFFSVAAVSDYTPTYPQIGKLKKENIGQAWQLELKKNIDILATIDKTNLYTIGFKAEMDKENGKQNGFNMLQNKKLDGVCLNILDDNNSFGSDQNTIEFLHPTHSFTVSGSKLAISFELLENLQKVFSE